MTIIVNLGARDYFGRNRGPGDVKSERSAHFLRDAFREEGQLFLYVYKECVGAPSSHLLYCNFIHPVEEHGSSASRSEAVGTYLRGEYSKCLEI